jgi:hypothetical protein
MRDCIVGLQELSKRLAMNGHQLWPETVRHSSSTDVWPSPATIATVAMELDGTLPPSYRHRYFACVLDAEEQPILQYHAAFQLSTPFDSIRVQEPPRGHFMVGPFLWLLRRLRGFSRILLWPREKYRKTDGVWFFNPWEVDHVGALFEWAREAALNSLPVDAVMLDLVRQRDCRVLWQIGNLVADSHLDYYVSNADVTEVYLLHHHDKVIISIPNADLRRKVIRELNEVSDVITDCSDYTCPSDSEYGWA